VAITGGSFTFPLTKFYSIVRGEMAYFRGQPFSRQGQGNSFDAFDIGTGVGTPGTKKLRSFNNTEGGVNPFVYPRFLAIGRKDPLWGTVLQRNTFNMSLGLDVNRYIRFLNPTQTFFFSTQVFYKHIFNSPGDLVLPVPFRNLPVSSKLPIIGNPNDPNNPLGALGGGCGPKVKGAPKGPGGSRPGTRACDLQPRLYPLQDNQVLQTLLITTAYSGGRIVPSFGIFYDWVGSWVFQPGVTFGAFGRYAKCAATGGCDENVHGYAAPVAFDSLLSAGVYLERHVANLRLGRSSGNRGLLFFCRYH
jgi:hypothetical protein